MTAVAVFGGVDRRAQGRAGSAVPFGEPAIHAAVATRPVVTVEMKNVGMSTDRFSLSGFVPAVARGKRRRLNLRGMRD
jgi:hypothetical protein